MLLLVVSLGLFPFLPDAVAGDDHDCKKVPIVAVEKESTSIRGNAFLCSDAHGVHAWLYGKGFEPGHAYTVWLFYIDDPSQCATPGQCVWRPAPLQASVRGRWTYEGSTH